MEGVVLRPSLLAITTGSLPSMTATHELVVPKSIPIIFPMLFFECLVSKKQNVLFNGYANRIFINKDDTMTAKRHAFYPYFPEEFLYASESCLYLHFNRQKEATCYFCGE
jgi:hypothetical protein